MNNGKRILCNRLSTNITWGYCTIWNWGAVQEESGSPLAHKLGKPFCKSRFDTFEVIWCKWIEKLLDTLDHVWPARLLFMPGEKYHSRPTIKQAKYGPVIQSSSNVAAISRKEGISPQCILKPRSIKFKVQDGQRINKDASNALDLLYLMGQKRHGIFVRAPHVRCFPTMDAVENLQCNKSWTLPEI